MPGFLAYAMELFQLQPDDTFTLFGEPLGDILKDVKQQRAVLATVAKHMWSLPRMPH